MERTIERTVLDLGQRVSIEPGMRAQLLRSTWRMRSCVGVSAWMAPNHPLSKKAPFPNDCRTKIKVTPGLPAYYSAPRLSLVPGEMPSNQADRIILLIFAYFLLTF